TLTGAAGDLLNDSKLREAYLGEGVALRRASDFSRCPFFVALSDPVARSRQRDRSRRRNPSLSYFFSDADNRSNVGEKTTRSQEIQRRKGESCENQVCATVGAGRRSCCFLSVPSRNCVLAGSGGQRSRSALRHP